MEINLAIGDVELGGDLTAPVSPSGLVVFAHGSGSSRHSGRNRKVAAALQERGLATLLFDLLTLEEEERDAIDAQLRFDIPLLAGRLVGVVEWVHRQELLQPYRIGLFGASTGAAAALIAAAQRPELVSAVVSRGGRPDLAEEWLPLVQAPTLLVVGGADRQVLELNRTALARLTAPGQLTVVPHATHLFEEPGALDEVARLAGDFFLEHLAGKHPDSRRGLGDTVC